MDGKADVPLGTVMESLRSAWDRVPRSLQQKLDAQRASSKQTLATVVARAQDTVQCQGKILELKAKLREAEDDLVKALSVKNRKEAKRIALMDLLLARRSRVEELKRNVQEQRAKRDQYDEILSPQSSVSKETGGQTGNGELQEAISWYQRDLGFHVEGGHGVKFMFKKISVKAPNEEFSFTIRHTDDTYTLLDCNPQLDDIKELIRELNRTNGLFKFVRIMRQKFQEAATQGILPQSTSLLQESSIISASAPAISISTDRNEYSAKKNEHQVQREQVDRYSKKQNRGRVVVDTIQSPGSVRRSSRLVKK